MNDFNVIGYKLNDGIRNIRRACDLDIITLETVGFSNVRLAESENLNDARIIRVSKVNDNIEVVYGYF
ncbi:hypothetical protein [Sporosalibacterium faouarense]|uniref:hypothetical protein n=1 Tax=Sporosalibacterium faouarense TaxID=516123 RepID=UPI00141C255E|nr:hypothetical protein [Sporosalibacterium faouarense]MTI48025.1 hypothetical protein [Bacillota bacterium]